MFSERRTSSNEMSSSHSDLDDLNLEIGLKKKTNTRKIIKKKPAVNYESDNEVYEPKKKNKPKVIARDSDDETPPINKKKPKARDSDDDTPPKKKSKNVESESEESESSSEDEVEPAPKKNKKRIIYPSSDDEEDNRQTVKRRVTYPSSNDEEDNRPVKRKFHDEDKRQVKRKFVEEPKQKRTNKIVAPEEDADDDDYTAKSALKRKAQPTQIKNNSDDEEKMEFECVDVFENKHTIDKVIDVGFLALMEHEKSMSALDYKNFLAEQIKYRLLKNKHNNPLAKKRIDEPEDEPNEPGDDEPAEEVDVEAKFIDNVIKSKMTNEDYVFFTNIVEKKGRNIHYELDLFKYVAPNDDNLLEVQKRVYLSSLAVLKIAIGKCGSGKIQTSKMIVPMEYVNMRGVNPKEERNLSAKIETYAYVNGKKQSCWVASYGQAVTETVTSKNGTYDFTNFYYDENIGQKQKFENNANKISKIFTDNFGDRSGKHTFMYPSLSVCVLKTANKKIKVFKCSNGYMEKLESVNVVPCDTDMIIIAEIAQLTTESPHENNFSNYIQLKSFAQACIIF